MRDLGPRKEPDPLRPGRHFDVDLQLRYLSPGAFTVLPPEDTPPPDPPQAPVPYRLTPTTRRNRNQSFSIIAEPTSKVPSRTTSPTGRISPFRGRGFNPTGSRHVSPAPSPPPETVDKAAKPPKTPTKKSKIPQIKRRNSSGLFGEKVSNPEDTPDSTPTKGSLGTKLSKSMSNISPGKVSKRPPPSPSRGYAAKSAFRQLSPILGSSPEPSQSQSSPTRIPSRSRSQPQSRLSSPSRLLALTSKTASNVNSRNPSRSTSRVQSRSTSREPSPSVRPSPSSSKPSTKYKNVQSKVNSFSKPKVPPKPQLTSDSELSDKPVTVIPRYKKKTTTTNARNGVNKIGATSTVKSRLNTNRNNNDDKSDHSKPSSSNINKTSGDTKKENVVTNEFYTSETDMTDNDTKTPSKSTKETKTTNGTPSTRTKKADNTPSSIFPGEVDILEINDASMRLFDELSNSTATIVPVTAATVTKPLKIDASADMKMEASKKISPMVDGRILSATSVSHAINRMNDTVLDTKTLMRESGLSKLSPAANAIISMSRENHTRSSQNSDSEMENKPDQTKMKDGKVEKTNTSADSNKKTPTQNNHSGHRESPKEEVKFGNHVTSTGLMDDKNMEVQVQNSMSKLIASEKPIGDTMLKMANKKVVEATNVISSDVRPIQILVKERPSDEDVESGNVRVPYSATNGSIHGRPSLPPDLQTNHNDVGPKHQEPPEEDKKPDRKAAKFFSSAKDNLLCKSCTKKNEEGSINATPTAFQETEEKKNGCFGCLKKKQKHIGQSIRISVQDDEEEVKRSCWDKMKCCGKKDAVGQQGCLPFGQQKRAWEERRDSILSDLPPRRSFSERFKSFMRRLFCLHLCKKKRKLTDLSVSRRQSTLSKKKSLTPTTTQQPIEDQTPKLELSLVEHSSHMKAAIPVLPISLAWFCLIMNCLLPGTGTVFSGMFCLCFGIPRFSQKDSVRSRIGAFIIDCIVGFSQCFTILFCLVGWGWSIWWGVIMVKLARKYKKLKLLAAAEEEDTKRSSMKSQRTHFKDPERGS
ncbi:protein stum [Harmonia axyridis]|uniref:protein stum n=1 Tax=Harmonia axyridis TaxID=115357 RepID=UPI001E276EA8|nr:protein stum [Harmonia axyridis]